MVVPVSLVARGIATGPLRLLRGYDAADPPMALDAVVAPAIPLQEPVDRGQQPNESYESAESSNSDDSTPTPSLIHSRSLQILVGTVGLLVGAFLFACLFMSKWVSLIMKFYGSRVTPVKLCPENAPACYSFRTVSFQWT